MNKPTQEMALVEQAPQDTLLAVIERAASNPDVNVEKMERLLAMQKDILQVRSEGAFNEALTAAQSEMRRVGADGSNPQTHSKYATYAALDKSLRPIYTKHGFSLSFDTGDAPIAEMVRVLCYVSNSGFTRTYRADMPADGKGAKGGDVMTKTHATGAAMSYGMRYLLKMIFNVAVGEDDDDGNTVLPRISENQVADLEALIEEVQADKAKYLKYLRVDSLDEITAQAYPDAVKALEAKRKAA